MLERPSQASTARYPQKVSFVIWGDETMRHEGVVESQIFYLLGTKPVWNSRGKVVDVQVIPRAQLNRPRVDIVIASAAEGMFNNVTQLMDKAVQKVKALDEADNYVRAHYLATKATLIEARLLGGGRRPPRRRAHLRRGARRLQPEHVDDRRRTAAPGTPTRAWPTTTSASWATATATASGASRWRTSSAWRSSGTEKIVHSSSTTLYGALDNDDMFMYMGGLATAVRNIDGKTPEMVVTNTRDPGKPEMTTIDKFIGTEFRSRYVNPTWIEGMKKEGYAGAGEMKAVRRVPVGLGRHRARGDRRREVAGDLRRLRPGQAQAGHGAVLRGEVAVRLSGHDRAHDRDRAQGLLEGRRGHAEEAARGVRRRASTATAWAAPRTPAATRGCRSTCSTRAARSGIPVPALDGFRQGAWSAPPRRRSSRAPRSCPASRGRTTRRWPTTCRRCRRRAAPARQLEGYLMEAAGNRSEPAARAGRGQFLERRLPAAVDRRSGGGAAARLALAALAPGLNPTPPMPRRWPLAVALVAASVASACGAVSPTSPARRLAPGRRTVRAASRPTSPRLPARRSNRAWRRSRTGSWCRGTTPATATARSTRGRCRPTQRQPGPSGG